jgi:elongation factor P
MKIGVNQVKRGNVIILDKVLHEVINFYTTQPGKGGAFAQIKLRNLDSGSIFEKRFRTEENVERAHLDNRKVQFLYTDGTDFHFMDNENFEQFHLNKEAVGDNSNYLLENMDISITFFEEKPLTIELPQAVNLKITYTEPGVKGNTASGTATKRATLETGLEVQVPLFIDIDETIKVDTRSGQYMERAKSS